MICLSAMSAAKTSEAQTGIWAFLFVIKSCLSSGVLHMRNA
jgi:hypothetical protein